MGTRKRPEQSRHHRSILRTVAIDRATPQPPDLRTHYPHFGKGDAEVWEQWLWNHQGQIRHVYYDIALGGVTIDNPDVDQDMARGWKYSTAIKIDAVAVMEAENLVIEVKPRAHMGAIGQALGYAMLLDHEPINDLPNVPCIVTLGTSAEVQQVADALNIRIDVVKEQAT